MSRNTGPEYGGAGDGQDASGDSDDSDANSELKKGELAKVRKQFKALPTLGRYGDDDGGSDDRSLGGFIGCGIRGCSVKVTVKNQPC